MKTIISRFMIKRYTYSWLMLTTLIFNITLLDSLAQSNNHVDGHYTNLHFAIKNPNKVKHLDLSYQEWTYIPRVLTIFPNLESLDMSGNYIQRVPRWFISLNSLKHLKLNNNLITFFPIALERINKQLVTLEINGNSMLIDDYLSVFGDDNLPKGL